MHIITGGICGLLFSQSEFKLMDFNDLLDVIEKRGGKRSSRNSALKRFILCHNYHKSLSDSEK